MTITMHKNRCVHNDALRETMLRKASRRCCGRISQCAARFTPRGGHPPVDQLFDEYRHLSADQPSVHRRSHVVGRGGAFVPVDADDVTVQLRGEERGDGWGHGTGGLQGGGGSSPVADHTAAEGLFQPDSGLESVEQSTGYQHICIRYFASHIFVYQHLARIHTSFH